MDVYIYIILHCSITIPYRHQLAPTVSSTRTRIPVEVSRTREETEVGEIPNLSATFVPSSCAVRCSKQMAWQTVESSAHMNSLMCMCHIPRPMISNHNNYVSVMKNSNIQREHRYRKVYFFATAWLYKEREARDLCYKKIDLKCIW